MKPSSRLALSVRAGRFLALVCLTSIIPFLLPFSLRAQVAGGLDPAFNPNVNGLVNASAVQLDGKIIVVGNFLGIDGQSRTNLARLNAGGALESLADRKSVV